jgi:hypothetical protein
VIRVGYHLTPTLVLLGIAGLLVAAYLLLAQVVQSDPARISLRGLATVLMITLAVGAASWLGAMALRALAIVGECAFIASMMIFVVWFYRARISADGQGWPQRRSPGWAVGAWFVPFLSLWYPFQMMADIWRAGLPPEDRANRALLPGLWWGCWLLLPFLAGSGRAIGFGPLLVKHLASREYTFSAEIPTPGKIAMVLWAVLTVLLIKKVSDGPLGRPGEPAAPVLPPHS